MIFNAVDRPGYLHALSCYFLGCFASLTTAPTNMTNSHTTDRHHHQRPNKKRMSNHCGGDGVLSTALCDPIWIW